MAAVNIALPEHAPAATGSDLRAQLESDIASARGRGDSQSVLRGLDMLAKLDGLYAAGPVQDDRLALPDAQVAQSLAGWLIPALRGLCRPDVAEADVVAAVRAALAGAPTPSRGDGAGSLPPL